MVDTAGEKKYEHLGHIAKAALTLSHGNAAPGGFFCKQCFGDTGESK